jgi:hypothetical protein
MSANTAPTIVSGQAPKNPPKNLEMKIVCTSFPVATATLKIENPNEDTSKGYLRPYNSEAGAHMIGPRANPSTYSEMPSMPTSPEILYSRATEPMAAEKIDEPNAAVSVTKASETATGSFFLKGQFWACRGSFGPSNSTTYWSLSGSMGGYSLPPPNPGRGFLDSLVAVRLRRLAPTVMFCWLRAVCMRLSDVGFLLRAMSSRIVGSRDRLISSRTMDMRDPLVELELAVSPVADLDNGALVFASDLAGRLADDARHLSLSASSSASSIR